MTSLTNMQVVRRTTTVLAIVAAMALMSPTAAPAHEGWQSDEDHRSAAARTTTAVPTAKAGDTCKKKGQVLGKLTCKKVGGKLKWATTSTTTTTSTSTSTGDLLCRNSTYTSQVTGFRCTTSTILFGANGLPGGSAPTMVGNTHWPEGDSDGSVSGHYIWASWDLLLQPPVLRRIL